MKKQFGKYYLGFDIGTESVGWSVTDTDYKVLKFNGKSMWGVHLFEQAQSAEQRRIHRCARRRTARISERLQLLKELFACEVDKVDPDFYKRLADSKFYPDDKLVEQKNSLFNDIDFNDNTYHDAFPTIYHLRSELIHSTDKHDIRLIYLALHHILKHRGHFLFEGQDFASVTCFENVFNELLEVLNDYNLNFESINANGVETLLKNNNLNIRDKKKEISQHLQIFADDPNSSQLKAISDLLCGSKVALSAIFDDDSLKDAEISSISLSDGIDEYLDKLADILDEKIYLISKLKAVYDWSVLVNILKGKEYLCDAKVAIYDTHKKDLETLKRFVSSYLTEQDKKEILKAENNTNNYPAYIGKNSAKPCSQKEFCDYLKKKFENIDRTNSDVAEFFARLENGSFMPRQVSKENSVIPYQLHLQECKAILNNAKQHFEFINQYDENGISIYEKVLSILTFRIPYYVGPLNPHSEHAWIEKRKNEKIYPWNFEEVVDLSRSAEEFILRMTNKCTYLPEKDVLPKQSVLYSKYNILNQLNNLQVNGEKLPIDIKQSIFNDLFLSDSFSGKVSFSKLKSYFKSKGYYTDSDGIELTGLDNGIVGDIKPYQQFRKICGEAMPKEETIDEIIKTITILGDSKELLKTHLVEKYGDIFSKEQITAISRLKFTGWGRFSKEFLTDIYHIDQDTGECTNIINMLLNSNDNLMQLLSRKYNFSQSIEKFNSQSENSEQVLNSEILKDLYVSPAVRRSIWRVVMISKEIVKITGREPKKIFVEVARDVNDQSKKKATTSRKNQLVELYKKCQIEEPRLLKELEQADDGELRDNRLFLYYTQLGRCMYSGERIELSQIYTLYDIDHIYPQSKVKDDSILSNKVLVKRELNGAKGDDYPIPKSCLGNNISSFWYELLSKKLITKEKYSRLTRQTSFSIDELSGFIARQLVETRQSSKAVAELLQKTYKESEVVYVKAGNVSLFRQQFEIPKSRLVNIYHHAKDAYLNIVVGNVYHEKFTKNPMNFLKQNPVYSMNKIFDYPLKKGEKVIWESDKGSSIKAVKAQVEKNNILFTRFATTNKGGFFDQIPVKAGKGQYPLKTGDKRLCNIERYGAYNKVSGAYFFLVEHTEKKKRVRTIEYVSIVKSKDIKTQKALVDYCLETGLVDPIILISKIKINTLFKINGFYMHLSGRTNNQLSFKGGMPLILSEFLYSYTQKIEKYVERNKQERTELPITKHQKITKEDNLKLYDELMNKLKNTIYNSKLSAQVDTFEKGQEKFDKLTLPEQCRFLYNAFSLFNTSAGSADLKLIGGSGQSGTLLISSNIANSEQISIINQSVTGLFQQEKDLKKL